MMNRRGGVVLIVFIVLAVLFLIGIGVTIYALSSKGYLKPEDERIVKIPLFLQPRDDGTQQPIAADHILQTWDSKGHLISLSEGPLEASWNELVAPRDSLFLAACWNDDHYLVKAYKINTPQELANNKSTFTCDMLQIGNASVNVTGSLRNKLSTVVVNVTTRDSFHRTSMCFAWSAGIIDVAPKSQYLQCAGNWTNFLSADGSDEVKELLPNGTYACGTEVQECQKILGTHCKLSNEKVPSRFKQKVDSCVSTGRSVHNSSELFELEVRTNDYRNQLDYLQIFIYDKDRRFNPSTEQYEWISEIDGQDIGSPDVNTTLHYE